MKTAAERIWAFHDGPFVGYFVGCEERGTNVAEYVRADIVATEIARLRAVLETIKSDSKHYARRVTDHRAGCHGPPVTHNRETDR